jgi:CRP-like cAMP-binding protein
MEPVSLRELKVRAAESMRLGDLEQALAIFGELENLESEQAAWPRQRADIHRRLGERGPELEALLRAAELYASGGFAIQAVATCRMILSIDPTHSATQEQLDELSADLNELLPPDADPPAPLRVAASAESPLEEILLTQVVPRSTSLRFGGETLEGAFEIPLDRTPGDGEIDLDLSKGELAEGPDEAAEGESEAESSGAGSAAREQLRLTPLFGSLSGEALRRVIDRVRLLEIAEGEVLFRETDPADALYVVVDGAVVPIAEGGPEGETRRKLAVLESGEFFGELGLVADRPRNTTIQTIVDTRLLEIDRPMMWDLIRERPEILSVILRFLRERLVDRLVRTSPIFAAFARVDRARFARQFRFLEIQDASQVIQQGHPAQALFVILSGQVDVILTDDDGDKVLATLGPGDLCGERSMLLREPAMAAVVSSGKCWALALSEPLFRRICDCNPWLQEVIEQVLESREQENSNLLKRNGQPEDAGLGLI